MNIFNNNDFAFFVCFTHSAIEIINFVHKAKHNLQEIRERVVKSWQVYIYMEGIHEQKFVRIPTTYLKIHIM